MDILDKEKELENLPIRIAGIITSKDIPAITEVCKYFVVTRRIHIILNKE
jgi:hypothetical protein